MLLNFINELVRDNLSNKMSIDSSSGCGGKEGISIKTIFDIANKI